MYELKRTPINDVCVRSRGMWLCLAKVTQVPIQFSGFERGYAKSYRICMKKN